MDVDLCLKVMLLQEVWVKKPEVQAAMGITDTGEEHFRSLWNCEECSSICSSSAALAQHLKTPGLCERKTRESGCLVCPRCDREFPRKGAWQRHVDYSPDCHAKKVKKQTRSAETAVDEFEDLTETAEADVPKHWHTVSHDHCYVVTKPSPSTPAPAATSPATPARVLDRAMSATSVYRSHVRIILSSILTLKLFSVGCSMSLVWPRECDPDLSPELLSCRHLS